MWLVQFNIKILQIYRNRDDHEILNASKADYKKKIKSLVQKAAFSNFMKLKCQHKKLYNIDYNELKIQSYVQNN